MSKEFLGEDAIARLIELTKREFEKYVKREILDKEMLSLNEYVKKQYSDLDDVTKDLKIDMDQIPKFTLIGSEEPEDPVDPEEPTTEEYNLIALATEVSTVDELKAYDGVAILKNHKQTPAVGTILADANYDVIKIPVQAGDVIRDMLLSYWRKTVEASVWTFACFYDSNGKGAYTNVHFMYFDGHSTPNYLELRENGITAPENAAYVLWNLYTRYYHNNQSIQADNGRTANIITKNADASLTAYDGASVLPNYVPVADRAGVAAYTMPTAVGDDGEVTETYYEAVDDVRIPRYEGNLKAVNASLADVEASLAGVETVLADVVGGVE